MDNYFNNLADDKQINLLRIAEEELNLPSIILEKDIWLCWLLETLFELPIQMVFKGGTSLSKVFNLINRFSEDVDITIDYRNFENELDFQTISRSQLKKLSDSLKKQLKNYVAKTVLPHLKQKTSICFPGKIFEFTLSDDDEKLMFYYPTVLSQQVGYLRDHILIEFGMRNSIEPCEKYPISPYIAEIADKDITMPNPQINTLSPIRTFWEKTTLIHVECYRERLTASAERLSRHWYDLFMLANSWVVADALARIDILENVIEYKKAFFNASYAHYDLCLSGNLKLIPDQENLNALKKDFIKMKEAGMFSKEPESFEEIINHLKKLEGTINQTIFAKTK